jgi:hypothetical protein
MITGLLDRANFAFLISRQTNKTNKHLYSYIIIICGEKTSYIYELSYENQQAHLAQVVRVHFLKDYVMQVQEV